MTDLHEYDPALAEAAGEGGGADEIAVIVRLSADWVLPDGVRMVSRFGDIATVRAPRERLADIATCDSVLALEASRPLRLVDAPPAEPDDDDAVPYLRRPPGVIGTGRGVVVAVLDWGIDLGHPAFRHDDGSTRFLAFWDQHGRPDAATAARWGYGRIYQTDEIDRALQAPDPYRALGYHPADADERDPESGEWKGAHGTHVLDIAAGNGRGGTMPGVVPEAHLVGVHLARTARVLGRANLGDSATVLEALDFAFAVAGDRPCAVNMSIGAHGGPHDGTTLVEQGIDRAISLRPGRAVILSAGNYAAAQAHARGRVQFGRDEVLRFTVPAEDPTGSELELYYASADRFTVLLVDPSHSVVARVASGADGPIVSGDAVVGHIYHIERGANVDRHVDVFLNPGAPAGVWQVRLLGEIIQDGRYHAWIERDRGLRPRFDRPNVDSGFTTGTLCNGRFAITV
ncbi:MAG: S8 family serine peptidase, partial [Micromonosporaceae bacterium]